MKNLRAKFSDHLRSKKPMLGTWLQIAHPTVVEAMAQTGFDFVLVDGEHAPTPPDVLAGVLPGLELYDCPSLYRVRSNNSDLIKGALDHGVSALMVPMVNSAEEAAHVVAASKYPPLGRRGIGAWRAANYYYNDGPYIAESNKDTAIIAQIETGAAVNAVEEIAAVPGLDALFVGPADLRMSVGLAPGLNSEFLETIKLVADTALRHNLVAGIDVASVDYIPTYMSLGFTLMTIGIDTSYIIEGGRDLSAKAKVALGHLKT